MMSSLRSLFAPKDRRPRRSSLVTLEVPEAFEARVVLSVSLATTIDGLKPPVLSLTLPQPTASGSQVVSLTLRPSSADPRLFKDAVAGKLLKTIEITLSDKGIGTTDTITLTNALISSFKVVTAPNGNVTDVISLVGRTVSSGSLAATIDGLKPPVLSLTLPQPTASGSQVVSLTLRPSSADPQLFKDAVIGRHLKKVEIILQQEGKKVTHAITLTNALISSFKVVTAPNGGVTEVISLAAQNVTID